MVLRRPLDQVLPTTIELFQSDLPQNRFKLATPDETATARKLERSFLVAVSDYRVMHHPSIRKQLHDEDSNLSQKYKKTLHGFKHAAQECTGNIKTTAICMKYFCHIMLQHYDYVQPNVKTRQQNVFDTYFDKFGKNLFKTVDACYPAEGDTQSWNAKNMALMAFANAMDQRRNPKEGKELSDIAERLLGDKKTTQPS